VTQSAIGFDACICNPNSASMGSSSECMESQSHNINSCSTNAKQLPAGSVHKIPRKNVLIVLMFSTMIFADWIVVTSFS
jgi:hypothetical protein